MTSVFQLWKNNSYDMFVACCFVFKDNCQQFTVTTYRRITVAITKKRWRLIIRHVGGRLQGKRKIMTSLFLDNACSKTVGKFHQSEEFQTDKTVVTTYLAGWQRVKTPSRARRSRWQVIRLQRRGRLHGKRKIMTSLFLVNACSKTVGKLHQSEEQIRL